MQRHKPSKYKDDDLLTLGQAADTLGYSRQYFQNLVSQGAREYDEDLCRMRVQTDETYRRAFRTRVQYVYPYGELVTWFTKRQSTASMKEWNAARGIVVE
jgi:hypothetical protein